MGETPRDELTGADSAEGVQELEGGSEGDAKGGLRPTAVPFSAWTASPSSTSTARRSMAMAIKKGCALRRLQKDRRTDRAGNGE